MNSITLRHYQKKITAGVGAAYAAGFTAPLAVAPTGAGKTIIFAFVAQGAAGKGLRSFIVCHRIELIKQTCKALNGLGVEYGVIHPDAPRQYDKLVQVCSVQTLANHIEELVAAGIIPHFLIYDEAHHATAGLWKTISRYLPAPRTLTFGVTATPIRTDGQGLGAQHQGGVFDTLVMGPQISELIAEGYLVKADVYAPESRVNMAGMVAGTGGDFAVRELEERVDRADLIGDAVAEYRRLADGLPAVAFCVSIAHAEHVAEQFKAAGYRAFAVSGDKKKTPAKLRERILAGLETGATQIVASCDLISEGTDIPALGCGLMLRPTASLSLFLQQAGRLLRPCAGKERAVLLDLAGNCLRHGMPEEDRAWSLDGIVKERKRKKSEGPPPPRVMTCTECHTVHIPGPNCIRCGHVYPVAEAEPMKTPSEGKLIHITEEIKATIMSAKEREIAEARTLEDLQKIAALRNYPAGWATLTFKMREKMRSPKLAI